MSSFSDRMAEARDREAAKGKTYWLIHEPHKTVGFATVDFPKVLTAKDAIAEARTQMDPRMLEMLDHEGVQWAARLVNLRYDADGKPIHTDVR